MASAVMLPRIGVECKPDTKKYAGMHVHFGILIRAMLVLRRPSRVLSRHASAANVLPCHDAAELGRAEL